jgi:hypothetical protein
VERSVALCFVDRSTRFPGLGTSGTVIWNDVERGDLFTNAIHPSDQILCVAVRLASLFFSFLSRSSFLVSRTLLLFIVVVDA